MLGRDLVEILNSTDLIEDQFSNYTQNKEFNFPDGGWVCTNCQNYNFCGRLKCNRCLKLKSNSDIDGKPKHLLRQNRKSVLSLQVRDRNEDWVCDDC